METFSGNTSNSKFDGELTGNCSEIGSKQDSSNYDTPINASNTALTETEANIEKAVNFLKKLKIEYAIKHPNYKRESYTQTSKTILELAKLEDAKPGDGLRLAQDKPVFVTLFTSISDKFNDSSSKTTRYDQDEKYSIKTSQSALNFSSNTTEINLEKSSHSLCCERKPLRIKKNCTVKTDLEAKQIKKERQQVSRFTVKSSDEKFNLKSRCLNLNEDESELDKVLFSQVEVSPKSQKWKASTFMSPTIASERKSNLQAYRMIKQLLFPIKSVRFACPKHKHKSANWESRKLKIPYIDEWVSNEVDQWFWRNVTDDAKAIENHSNEAKLNSTLAAENVRQKILNRIRHNDWNIALRGLAEITELSRISDKSLYQPYMVAVNQKLLELMKNPRTQVCRAACQAAGRLFETMKNTHRPEFDEIVQVLLSKTSTSNKLIRQAANFALDCMVTNIPLYHSVKSLCLKGPTHKNHIVRAATVRLLIYALTKAGPKNILHPKSNNTTRRRIVVNMAKFIADKNLETRKYGGKLFEMLCDDPYFDIFLRKYLSSEELCKFWKSLRYLYKNRQC